MDLGESNGTVAQHEGFGEEMNFALFTLLIHTMPVSTPKKSYIHLLTLPSSPLHPEQCSTLDYTYFVIFISL